MVSSVCLVDPEDRQSKSKDRNKLIQCELCEMNYYHRSCLGIKDLCEKKLEHIASTGANRALPPLTKKIIKLL
jgi:hypothetical protein